MNNWQEYVEEMEKWRAERDEQWRQENGWLALAGLYWLEQGESRMGTGSEMEIQLPAGTAPDYLATLTVTDTKVQLTAPEGSPVFVDGERVTDITLVADRPGPATLVSSGSLVWFIKREDDFMAVRLWDNSRPERKSFPGREWYPLEADYRVAATYTPRSDNSTESFPRTFGMSAEREIIGQVEFEIGGQQLSLQALPGMEGRLFLILKDSTSGQTTYGAGRYLMADAPVDGKVLLDFNQAFNPPCSITDFATCMFPPPSNHLSVAIPAGEKYVSWQH